MMVGRATTCCCKDRPFCNDKFKWTGGKKKKDTKEEGTKEEGTETNNEEDKRDEEDEKTDVDPKDNDNYGDSRGGKIQSKITAITMTFFLFIGKGISCF